MKTELVTKLNPRRFTSMSGKMAAIVGYILGERFTNPSFQEIAITSDGYVLAGVEGDCGMNEWIGAVEDLERNWHTLLEVADLTEEEKQQAELLYTLRVEDWRRIGFDAEREKP